MKFNQKFHQNLWRLNYLRGKILVFNLFVGNLLYEYEYYFLCLDEYLCKWHYGGDKIEYFGLGAHWLDVLCGYLCIEHTRPPKRNYSYIHNEIVKQ